MEQHEIKYMESFKKQYMYILIKWLVNFYSVISTENKCKGY